MIEYLVGLLAQKNPDSAIIEVDGIGYLVGMSGTSLADLPELGSKVKVLTDMEVRDDSIALYGFTSQKEKDLFLRLITVSGVGPKVALAALSTFNVETLSNAILNSDVKMVSHVPGIGKKTAQRIILELKGSLESVGTPGSGAAPTNTVRSIEEALMGMGFSPDEAELAVKGAPDDASEKELLHYALKRLGAKE